MIAQSHSGMDMVVQSCSGEETMSLASIKLCRFDGVNAYYNVRVMSGIGEKIYHVHDATGVGRFMRFHRDEQAVPLRADNITRMNNRILQVDSILRAQPVIFNCRALLDHRIRMKWVPIEKAGPVPLDGSVEVAGGYRYFANQSDAVQWITEYLTPILQKANEYVAKTTIDKNSDKEIGFNWDAQVYAKENSDAYGEEFGEAVTIPTPNTWWASLTDQQRNEIYQKNRRG